MSVSASDPTRKPRRWRWLLMIAAAVLLVDVLPALLLAQWGPYFLGRALSAYLQTSVTVQGVTGGWWNGVTVHQLTVAEDRTPRASTLVRIEHLTGGREVRCRRADSRWKPRLPSAIQRERCAALGSLASSA